MPPVSMLRGGFCVSNPTRASRCPSAAVSKLSLSLFSMIGSLQPVRVCPQRGTHAKQLDETLGLFHPPIGRLGVGGPGRAQDAGGLHRHRVNIAAGGHQRHLPADRCLAGSQKSLDRKSTRLNSSHVAISYAVFCLKKKSTT